jgi:hypothetical protein
MNEMHGQVFSERKRKESRVANASVAMPRRRDFVRNSPNSYAALFINMPGNAGDYRHRLIGKISDAAECFIHKFCSLSPNCLLPDDYSAKSMPKRNQFSKMLMDS